MENEETAMRALEAAPEDPLLLERRIRVERAKAHRSLTIRTKGEARIVQEEEGGGEEGGKWVVRWNGEGGEEREEVKVSCQREREREGRDVRLREELTQRFSLEYTEGYQGYDGGVRRGRGYLGEDRLGGRGRKRAGRTIRTRELIVLLFL